MKPASILVTDDDSNIRLMLRTALESEGYLIQEASSGRQALDAIARCVPDLVVLDLNMPVMDGMAVLEELKSLARIARPRVIILTAYGSIPAAVKATRLGAIDFLEKPIEPSELRHTVRSILNEPELDAPPADAERSDNYDRVLDRIRKSLRLADYVTAEDLLSQVADRCDKQTPPYFNLLGVVYEAHHKWRLARKCYGKALTADQNYRPAQANMRRLQELLSFGRGRHPVMLGDEHEDTLLARLPDPDD
jgi:CheY-like chemotaxis protein